MPTIPDGFCQATLQWSSPVFDRGVAATVIGLNRGPVENADIPLAVISAWEHHLQDELHTEIVLEKVISVTATLRAELAENQAGTRTGDMSPPNVCILERSTTGMRGAANRGRNYWPGFLIDGDVQDTGAITLARIATLQSALFDFHAELADSSISPVVLHSSVTAPTNITGFLVEGKIATQRRRLR